MEYNLPSELVKNLDFGQPAKEKIIAGAKKLAKAVKSTLGASGRCVIYEDGRGKPVITKDGVTVAESVVLYDPVENMGATLVKESARNTVREAGDGTTTATVLTEAIIDELDKAIGDNTIRELKEGVNSGLKKVIEFLDEMAIDVEGDMLRSVSTISCNNDPELGAIIAEAYERVGKNGVVLMETSDTEDTIVDVVDGVQLQCGLTSPHFITNTDKHVAELEEPLVLTVMSEIPNVRKIQSILEYVIKKGRALLIIAPVAQQVKAALMMNKVKGNIKINIIDPPGFGPTKADSMKDIAMITGSTVINEELGDDLDLISVEHLGEADFAVTSDQTTILTISDVSEDLDERIKSITKLIAEEQNGFLKRKLEDRLATISGGVGIIRVGANSKVELKEKKDRVEDAIYATKAALKEGVIPGGGSALYWAAHKIPATNEGEAALLEAIKSPFYTILNNAGIDPDVSNCKDNCGIDVITGECVNMVDAGIVDPVLVTKSALKNAVSVANTIMSADCVISNIRVNESH